MALLSDIPVPTPTMEGAKGYLQTLPGTANDPSIAAAKTATFAQALQSAGVNIQNAGPGFVQGYQAAVDRANQDAKLSLSARAMQVNEGEFGLAAEQQSWKAQDRDTQLQIHAGMQQAAAEGGFEGVMDYLSKADPAQALQFGQEKVKLDNAILGNEVLQATSKTQKEAAMLESYSVLSRMGQAVLNADPKERDAMYQQIYPIISKVNPEAPKNVNDAIPMFMLAAAQGAPQNQLYKYGKAVAADNSALGKINTDIDTMVSQGATVQNSAGLRALIEQRDGIANRGKQADMRLALMQIQQENQKQNNVAQGFNATQAFNTKLESTSKDFTKMMDSYTGFQGALDTLAKDPKNASAQALVGRSVAKFANGGGVMTDIDVSDVTQSNSDYQNVMKKFESAIGTGRIALSPKEVGNLQDLMQDVMNRKLQRQDSIEKQYVDGIKNYGDLIDFNAVRLPSQQYTKQQVLSTTINSGKVPADLQAMAQQAIQQGADPKAVQARIQQMMQQMQGQKQ